MLRIIFSCVYIAAAWKTTMNFATISTVIQAAMELVNSDSGDEEFDDLVAMFTVKKGQKSYSTIL